MANEKLNRAFDVMTLALGEAGCEAQTIVKFVQHARQFFGIAHETTEKTRLKADLSVLAGELKEQTDDSSLDGRSEADESRKARRARADSPPS